MEAGEMIEMVLSAVVLMLSVMLVVVSFLAYRRTGMRALVYVGLAFLALSFKKVVDLVALSSMVRHDAVIIGTSLEALFMVLFMVALWRE
ncbi:MAG: hypothetical protein GXO14_04465 [Thermococci archaeon]|nr:hypothetical protein [Thermococci archaeon]